MNKQNYTETTEGQAADQEDQKSFHLSAHVSCLAHGVAIFTTPRSRLFTPSLDAKVDILYLPIQIKIWNHLETSTDKQYHLKVLGFKTSWDSHHQESHQESQIIKSDNQESP